MRLFIVLQDEEAVGILHASWDKAFKPEPTSPCQQEHHLLFPYSLPMSASSLRVLAISEVLAFCHSFF